ncbi:MAG: diaminopimelate decarboxylase [Proteobacteria bacterium]|nr:diaminopimelate decarboxylase [Pseudomonadota bacterium]MBU1709724.1 diaminopimelate decarboxylase [Pseudomonadota bacterium]
MHHFTYKNNTLSCENVSIPEIARKVGTPFYLYSTETLTRHFQAFDTAFKGIPHITCFATKACSNIAILRLFSGLGGGADIVSGGELFRALTAGIDPQRIVYSGVGKTDDELRYALESGILLFNLESEQELDRLQDIAAGLGRKAPVAFRVNPDVDPKTHAYISTGLAKNKFGIPIDDAVNVYSRANSLPNIEVIGVSCHIGSQLTDISPVIESLHKLKIFITKLQTQGIEISYLDLGGGLGITYDSEAPPHPIEYASAIKAEMQDLNCTLILEPGRVIVGNAAILVTKVLYTKRGKKNFVIVDAGMNDLARPSLYNAFHGIQPVIKTEGGSETADLVGPICESGDFLARGVEIPIFERDDLIAVMSAGAYGFTMSSNYNSRPRVPEILVHGDTFHTIRKREARESLIMGEAIPDFLK